MPWKPLLLLVFCLQAQTMAAYFQIQTVPSDSQRVAQWIELSKEAMQGNFPLAKSYGDSALALSQAMHFEWGLLRAHRQIATACYYGGQLDSAIYHYQKQMAFYVQNGDELNRARTIINIGLVKRNQGLYDEAMAMFFESLQIKEALQDTNSIAFSHKTIGETYAIIGNTEEAAKHFEKAVQGFQAVENTEMEYTMILNLGGFYRENGDLERSRPLILQAKDYFEEVDNRREMARAYYLLGGLAYDTDQLLEAEEHFMKSRTLFEEMGAPFRINGCEHYLSQVALKQGDFNKAEALAQGVVERSKAIGSNAQTARALYLLYEIQKEAKRFDQALDYFEAYHEVQDSIENEETTKNIDELRLKYETAVKEAELVEMESQLQISELARKQQRNRAIGLSILAALLLLILILIYRLYRDKQRNNAQLLEKNALIQKTLGEREVLLREIHHRVKNNLQFISSLLNLQSRHTADESALAVLNDSKTRINSMLLVHQKLYQEDNLTGVQMSYYIDNLLDSLIHAYQIDRRKVQVNADIQELNLDIDTAIPIGLILNEVLTNAFKYAFRETENGTLTVELHEVNDRLLLYIQDNGPGLPVGFDPMQSEQFGMELVRSLATKLKAELELKNEGGLGFSLFISNYKKV